MPAVTLEKIEMMVRSIIKTKETEIGCAECFSVLDQFLDLIVAGKDASQMMPLIQDHLDRCRDCHEEYEAILEALKAIS